MQQYGEAEWKRMSELERQRKMVELRRKERQLRHEGKMDEVEALLGQHLKHKQGKHLHVVWGSFSFSFSIFFSELSSLFSIFILSASAASET